MAKIATKTIEDKVKRGSNYHNSKMHHITGKLVVMVKILIILSMHYLASSLMISKLSPKFDAKDKFSLATVVLSIIGSVQSSPHCCL